MNLSKNFIGILTLYFGERKLPLKTGQVRYGQFTIMGPVVEMNLSKGQTQYVPNLQLEYIKLQSNCQFNLYV